MPKTKTVTLKELLEAGAHFGHQVKKWNPRMKEFIYTARDGIHVIDLSLTQQKLEQATEFIKKAAADKKNIVFAGTKRQAAAVIKKHAQQAQVFYLTQRWLGGLITNFENVKKPIARLEKIDEILGDEAKLKEFTTKERFSMQTEQKKLEELVGGLKGLKTPPEVLFIIDPKKEASAVREANKKGVPIVALLDTNANPDVIDYPIPGNDDAIKSIELIVKTIAKAVAEGRKQL